MPEQSEKIGYLYINGLGSGNIALKDKLVRWWWRRAGRTIEHAGINWYDEGTLSKKEEQVEERVNQMLKTLGGVAIIGGSAGGSLALNVFSNMKHANICAIAAHARVKVGDYKKSNRMSLFRRAKMNTSHPAPAFLDSVVKVEKHTIPNLTIEDRARLLCLTQLTDMVVDQNLMQLEGVETHRSVTFGHSGGFLAHLLADRDLITCFAEERLLK
jgi:hypothetical protein